MFAICGCSGCVSQRLNDASDAVEQNGNQEYNLNGVRWEVDPVVHQAGATVTWSMATANYLADYIQFDGFISDAQFISVIRAAFDAWEQVTNIDFVEVSDSSNVDIRLGYGDIDGSSGTLGVAYYSWNGSNELTQSFIEFDSAENWNLNIGGGGPGISAYIVALHEIGHAIGIGHSDNGGAVMAAFLNNSLTGLTQDDIDAAQAIYGSLAAGGGGGGGGTPANSDPDGVSLSANSVTENASAGTLIGMLTASDPDAGDTHSFEIIAQSSGAGWSNFEIVGDQLRLATGADIDFESNESFQLTIRVTDQDDAFFDQSVTVQVNNQAITDIALTSGGSVAENAFGGTSVATFAAFESGTPETAQLSLINDAGGLFVLDGNVLRVANGATLDYETDTSHVVRIRATDGTGPAHEENFVIQIENVAISDISMSGGSVGEDAGGGTSVAQFQVFEGVDDVAASLTLIDDAGGLFVLDGNTLKLAAGAQLDFETETSHTVRIGATDGNGSGLEEDFLIQVVNVPVQDITLSGNFITENAAAGTEIGQLQAFDEQVLPLADFTLVDDAGGLFVLDGDVLKLAPAAQLDFESAPTHTVRVSASDGSGPAHEEEFTVQLINTAISDIALATGGSVLEGAAAGTEVATFQAFDDQLESTAQFSLLDDAGGRFVLDGNTLRVAAGAALDFEDATSHTVRISATDGNGPAREEDFAIEVSNTSISDIALVSGGSIQENAASGTEVASFEAYEFGGVASAQFSLLDDAGGLFVLEQNVLKVANGAAIDYETATSHTVLLQAVDGSGQPYEEEFVIQIANMAISDIAIASGGSVNENSAADTVVATFEASENPLEPSAIYTLVDDANGLFYLDGNTLKVADGATLDFEVATSHTVRVSATDGTGPAHEEDFVIDVNDLGGTPITGDGGANKLDGTQENDQIDAGSGDDTIQESAGSDVIDGEGGNDTVVYGGSRSDYQQQLLGLGMVRVDKPGGNSDTLFNIERIDLTDGDFVFDIDSPNIGFSYRIYQAAFGRTPDEGGLRFWTGVLDGLDERGWSDEVKQQYIATQFNQSDEFRDLYGANPSNFDYIDAMYVNVLFRLPDQEGYDFWVGGMENGLTREQILIAFSESDENVQNNQENLDNGVWVV